MLERERKFEATGEQTRGRVFVRLPFDPNAAWGDKASHYIRGSGAGKTIRGPLASSAGGYFVALGEAWRRDNHVAAGDRVEVVL